MASEKERRDHTTTKELEKEMVPKLTTHFESLSEKVKGGDVPPGEREIRKAEEAEGKERTGPRTVGKFEMDVGEGGHRDDEEKTALSPEEISKYRQKAQQNSVEAVKAAEERYHKAKETVASKEAEAKEAATPRLESAKDAALEKSRQGCTSAKDSLVSAGKTAADYTKEKAEQAKDYTLQKAAQAKDVVVSSGETTAHYVGEKVGAAKDASVGAAEYAGKKAAATGWGVAYYTKEKAAEATKAVAGAIQSSAPYTDEKVVDYTARKKEAVEQDLGVKKWSEIDQGEETKVLGRDEREVYDDKRREGGIGGVLEAVGETVLEIAQGTKELVIGKDRDHGDTTTPSNQPR